MIIEGQGEVRIDDNFHSGKNCLIISQIHNFDKGSSIPYDSSYIIQNIHVQKNVWVGSRVVILGGLTIGEGAIIQAGSIVVGDIPKFSIAGGHPAKVIGYRDINHYKKLYSQGKFH